MDFEQTQPEQPELKLVRSAYECSMAMAEKMPWKPEGDSPIVAVAVPPELHDQYRQKFELYAKYGECFKVVKAYILRNITVTNAGHLSIDIPPSIHHLLKERNNELWDFDSRLEVFENLRTYIEKKSEDPEFLKEISKKCGRPAGYLILLDADTEEEGYVLWVEIYFSSKEVENQVTT